MNQIQAGQGHRAVLFQDQMCRAPPAVDPGRELLCIGNSRRKPYQGDFKGKMNNDLLPHRAPRRILEVVDLVHDYDTKSNEGARVRVDHVAQDFGGHDDHRSIAVDRVVAGEKPGVVGSILCREICVLLVGKCLDGSGVEGSLSSGDCCGDCGFGNKGFPGRCWRGDQDRFAVGNYVESLTLKAIRFEIETGNEVVDRSPGGCHFLSKKRTSQIVTSYRR